jgi:NitT/TauT family transport system permease protein
MLKIIKSIIYICCTCITVIALWMTLIYIVDPNPLFVPSPIDVYISWRAMMQGHLGYDIVISWMRVLSGSVLSVICALLLSMCMAHIYILKKILSPGINFLNNIPITALVPLIIVVVGIEEWSRIMILFLWSFLINTVSIQWLIHHIDHHIYELAQSLGYNLYKICLLQLHAIKHAVYDLLYSSICISWTYVILAEMMAATNGIGFALKDAARYLDIPKIRFLLIVLGCIGLTSHTLYLSVRKYLFSYLPSYYHDHNQQPSSPMV